MHAKALTKTLEAQPPHGPSKNLLKSFENKNDKHHTPSLARVVPVSAGCRWRLKAGDLLATCLRLAAALDCREHHGEYGALERRGGSSTRRSEANPAATHVCFAGQLINKAALRAQPSGGSALQPLIRIVAATDQQVSTTPITTGLLRV